MESADSRPFGESAIVQEGSHVERLLSWLPAEARLSTQLLFRASTDGDAEAFHERCDGAPRTLVLCQARDGSVFGGFASAAWNSAGPQKHSLWGHWVEAPGSFIFTLKNTCESQKAPYRIEPRNAAEALKYSRKLGPVFGKDLIIERSCRSCTLLANNYGDESGRTVSTVASGRSTIVPLVDMEVFQCA